MTFWLAAPLLLLAYGEAPLCVPREEMTRILKERFQQISREGGVANGGSLVQMFVGPEGNFTMVVVKPGGESCAVIAGTESGIPP